MRFTAITTTALLAVSALAAPTPEAKIAHNTATCDLKYLTYGGKYTVNIGRPYLGGKGCDYVKAVLKKNIPNHFVNSFKCVDNGFGQTEISWKTNGKQTKVNNALEAAYPTVPFVSKNVCNPFLP